MSAAIYTLLKSADFQHSHAICDVSAKAGLDYPSLEMVSTSNYDVIDAGHSMVKPADSALQNSSTKKVDEPMEAGTFGFDMSHLFKLDRPALNVIVPPDIRALNLELEYTTSYDVTDSCSSMVKFVNTAGGNTGSNEVKDDFAFNAAECGYVASLAHNALSPPSTPPMLCSKGYHRRISLIAEILTK